MKQWLPVVLWAGLILSSANDYFSSAQTGGILQSLFGDIPPIVHALFRKLAHVVGYGILGALAWRADRRWWVGLLIAVVVATTDETLQSRSAMRTGTAWDVLLDVTAAAITVSLLRLRRASPEVSSSPSSPTRAD